MIEKSKLVNYLIAVPLIVMSYHIFNFYESEPWIIRLGLAASFDVMVVVSFYLLKDEHINKVKRARQVTWATLMVLIGFQLYVNIWAYWELSAFRAIVSGAIFPLVVGMISYIGMIREQQAEKVEADERKKREALKALRSNPEPGIEETHSRASVRGLADERPFKGKRVEKADVISAWNANQNAEDVKQVFLGSSNMRSVYRWLNKLENGEQP